MKWTVIWFPRNVGDGMTLSCFWRTKVVKLEQFPMSIKIGEAKAAAPAAAQNGQLDKPAQAGEEGPAQAAVKLEAKPKEEAEAGDSAVKQVIVYSTKVCHRSPLGSKTRLLPVYL